MVSTRSFGSSRASSRTPSEDECHRPGLEANTPAARATLTPGSKVADLSESSKEALNAPIAGTTREQVLVRFPTRAPRGAFRNYRGAVAGLEPLRQEQDATRCAEVGGELRLCHGPFCARGRNKLRPTPCRRRRVRSMIENPKGKLLEFCARARALAPTIAIERSGDQVGRGDDARGLRPDAGERDALGAHARERRAGRRRELLAELATRSEPEPGELVTQDEEAALRLANPKGKLLERCVLLRVAPVFDVHPVLTGDGNGFEASVNVTLSTGDEPQSDVRLRSLRKGGRASRRGIPPSSDPRDEDGVAVADTTFGCGGCARRAQRDAHARGLRDYGFVMERIDGPPHAPIFFVEPSHFARTATASRCRRLRPPRKRKQNASLPGTSSQRFSEPRPISPRQIRVSSA